jgi:acetyl esterase/lipase
MAGSFVRGAAAAAVLMGALAACEVTDPTAAQLLPAWSARSAVVAEVDPVDVTCSYSDSGGAVTSTLRVWEPDPSPADPLYVAPPAYAAPGERPVVVYLRGTGWTDPPSGSTFGQMDANAYRAGGALKSQLDQGWVVVEASYRMAPTHVFPAQVIDAKAAVNCARDLTGAPGVDATIDTDRVVIAGSSSGGHLATLVGLTAGRWEPGAGSGSVQGAPEGSGTTVRAMVNLDAPNDLRSLWGPASNVRNLISGLFCGTVDPSTPGCDETVDAALEAPITATSGPASPIDWIPDAPVAGPSPLIYLACGDTAGLAPAFVDCADHLAMYDRLLTAYGDDPDEPGSAMKHVWIDETPGDHFSIDPTLNHYALQGFLQYAVT